MSWFNSRIFDPSSPLYCPFILRNPEPVVGLAEGSPRTCAETPDALSVADIRKAIDLIKDWPKPRYFCFYINPEAAEFRDWLKQNALKEISVMEVMVVPEELAVLLEFDRPHYMIGANSIDMKVFDWRNAIKEAS